MHNEGYRQAGINPNQMAEPRRLYRRHAVKVSSFSTSGSSRRGPCSFSAWSDYVIGRRRLYNVSSTRATSSPNPSVITPHPQLQPEMSYYPRRIHRVFPKNLAALRSAPSPYLAVNFVSLFSSLPRQDKFMYTCPIDAEPLDRYKRGGYHPIRLGSSLCDGRYKILHKLGWGGYSTVWAARDQRLYNILNS